MNLNFFKKNILEMTVFSCGAVVMIFELTGSRLLAPYVGTSIFVWTSLIGVIMGSLSLGYALGGRLADKKANINVLAFIIFLSAVFIGTIFFLQGGIPGLFKPALIGIELASLFISLILFSPASVLLGMVTPYVIKLKLSNLEKTGTTAGNLYAISTVGSIVGTFLAGFYLIPHLGSSNIIFILSLVLALNSVLLSARFWKLGLSLLILVFIMGASNVYAKKVQAQNGFFDIDSQYNRIMIAKSTDYRTGRPTLNLVFDPFGTESAMFLDSDELVLEYSKYYHLAKHFNPGFEKSLLLGGAAYSFPKDYLKKYPDAKLDVVEIDPKLTELAKKHFRLEENPRMRIFHEDGRVFLNSTEEKYDVIFGDAFQSLYSIPYQLTTKEAVQKEYDALNDDGIVILNTISSIEGKKGRFLRAEYETYKTIFPQVYLFPVRHPDDGEKIQNVILVALKSGNKPSLKSADKELDKFLQHLWKKNIEKDVPILEDEFAPVDFYVRDMI